MHLYVALGLRLLAFLTISVVQWQTNKFEIEMDKTGFARYAKISQKPLENIKANPMMLYMPGIVSDCKVW